MTEEDFKIKDNFQRHAIQTGIAAEYALAGLDNNDPIVRQLKHLRTGLNCCMVEHSTVIRLLLDANIITDQQYYEASIRLMNEEIMRIEEILAEKYGRPVNIG